MIYFYALVPPDGHIYHITGLYYPGVHAEGLASSAPNVAFLRTCKQVNVEGRNILRSHAMFKLRITQMNVDNPFDMTRFQLRWSYNRAWIEAVHRLSIEIMPGRFPKIWLRERERYRKECHFFAPFGLVNLKTLEIAMKAEGTLNDPVLPSDTEKHMEDVLCYILVGLPPNVDLTFRDDLSPSAGPWVSAERLGSIAARLASKRGTARCLA